MVMISVVQEGRRRHTGFTPKLGLSLEPGLFHSEAFARHVHEKTIFQFSQ